MTSDLLTVTTNQQREKKSKQEEESEKGNNDLEEKTRKSRGGRTVALVLVLPDRFTMPREEPPSTPKLSIVNCHRHHHLNEVISDRQSLVLNQ